MRRFSAWPAIILIATGATCVSAADPMAWLPGEVNAVARINVAELYQTPLAKKEGWAKKATESFIQQEAFFPPGTNQIFIGADLNLLQHVSANRAYTVLVPEGGAKLEKLSAWLPGGIEKISGKSGAKFGDDDYVVDAGDGCWLATSNANSRYPSGNR